MANYKKILVTIFLSFLLNIMIIHEIRAQDYRLPDEDNEVERIMINEMKALNSKFGMAIELWISNSGKIKAEFDKGIIVDINLLENYRSSVNISNHVTAIRLILAHEFAHFLQFRKYKEKLSNLSWINSVIFECQADILAGKYCSESIAESKVDKSIKAYLEKVPLDKIDSLTILENTFNLEALKLYYQIGANENEVSDHPYKEQRLLAVKLGIESSLINMLDIASKKFNNILSEDEMNVIYAKKFQIIKNSKLRDPYNIDSLMDWSLWQSKRIIHYETEAMKDLIISGADIEWDTDLDNPYVSYKYHFFNKGEKKIFVDFQIRCDAVLRNNSDSNIYSGFLQSKDYDIQLEPNQSIIIEDKIDWTYRKKQFMPRIISPTDPIALLSCSYSPSTYEIVEYNNNIKKDFELYDSEIELRTLSANLLLLLQDDTHFRKFISSSGEGTLDSDGQPSKYGFIVYKCFNPFSKIDLNISPDDTTKRFVEFTIYEGSDKDSAFKAFDTVLEHLKSSLPNLQFKTENNLILGELKVVNVEHNVIKNKKIKIISEFLEYTKKFNTSIEIAEQE